MGDRDRYKPDRPVRSSQPALVRQVETQRSPSLLSDTLLPFGWMMHVRFSAATSSMMRGRRRLSGCLRSMGHWSVWT